MKPAPVCRLLKPIVRHSLVEGKAPATRGIEAATSVVSA
jgi:hypothetical protein